MAGTAVMSRTIMATVMRRAGVFIAFGLLHYT